MRFKSPDCLNTFHISATSLQLCFAYHYLFAVLIRDQPPIEGSNRIERPQHKSISVSFVAHIICVSNYEASIARLLYRTPKTSNYHNTRFPSSPTYDNRCLHRSPHESFALAHAYLHTYDNLYAYTILPSWAIKHPPNSRTTSFASTTVANAFAQPSLIEHVFVDRIKRATKSSYSV